MSHKNEWDECIKKTIININNKDDDDLSIEVAPPVDSKVPKDKSKTSGQS